MAIGKHQPWGIQQSNLLLNLFSEVYWSKSEVKQCHLTLAHD